MYKIIPKPMKLQVQTGFFLLNLNSKIKLSPDSVKMRKTANFLIKQVYDLIEIEIKFASNSSSLIVFKIAKTGLGTEGYKLKISKNKIKITAEAENGIFYGIQTLLQLLPTETWNKNKTDSNITIPCCEIEDKPRFGWRGMHLDVSRHFFGIDFIKKYIDLLALHKLNIFHWHLTDDNGWRIEIKKYPELTKTCAWRKDLEHLPWNKRDHSDDPGKGNYGGFYTQKEIKEVVKYAADRFITIIPEIEMPGHSREVFAAYPQFSCLGKKLTVASGGYWPNLDIFCAGKAETFEFLKNILSEVIELFPSKYIHIGGDEADKTRWKKCPLCQKRIKDENLKDEKELQSWFIKQIADFLENKNKKLIGWDEIIDGGLIDKATVMCWRGDGKDAAKIAVKKSCNVVMCPNPYLYFDWKQNEKDAGAFGVTTLEKVYNYEPIPAGFSQSETEYILGAQGNVWTEWMPSEQKVEFMALPRMSALAELAWTDPDKKKYTDFINRLNNICAILMNKHVNFNTNFGEN